MYFEIESNRINTFVNKVENDGNSCNGLPSSEEIAPLNEAQVSSPPPYLLLLRFVHSLDTENSISIFAPLCYRHDFPQDWM